MKWTLLLSHLLVDLLNPTAAVRFNTSRSATPTPLLDDSSRKVLPTVASMVTTFNDVTIRVKTYRVRSSSDGQGSVSTTVQVKSFATRSSPTSRTSVAGSSSTITQVSLYAGLILFGAVLVIICLVATLASTPEDHPSDGSRCCRRLMHLGDSSAPEVDARPMRSSSTSRHGRSPIQTFNGPPPTYDEVVSVAGSEQNLISMVTRSDADVLHSPTNGSVTDATTTGDVTCPSLVELGTVNDADSSGRRRDGRSFLMSAGRRFLDSISPPNYFQVIRDLASRGIIINRTLLTTPPPSYSDLETQRRSAAVSSVESESLRAVKVELTSAITATESTVCGTLMSVSE